MLRLEGFTANYSAQYMVHDTVKPQAETKHLAINKKAAKPAAFYFNAKVKHLPQVARQQQ